MIDEKAALDGLAETLKTYGATRGADGEYVIQGKKGNIHCDGDGFSFYAECNSKRGLHNALAELLPILTPRQRADTEFVAFGQQNANYKPFIHALRRILGLQKRKRLTPEQREKAVKNLILIKKA